MRNRRESSGSGSGSSSGSSSSSVSPRSRIITRSISKRRPRLLPLRDASLSFAGSGNPIIRDMLKKQHEKVLNRGIINGGGSIFVDWSKVKITYSPHERHTPDTRAEALDQLGVIWSGCSSEKRFKPTEEYVRSKTQARVLKMVAENVKLPQRDLLSLMPVCRVVYNTLISTFPLWLSLDFHRMNKAGDRLVAALSLKRFYNLEHINLAWAEDIADKHLKLLITEKKVVGSLGYLESLNLDGCQNISNKGVKDVTSACPRLKKFSICGNLRVTDFGIKSLVKNCKCLTDLNLSGCKNLTDNSLVTIGNTCPLLESLDISRCEQVTDDGVVAIAEGCPQLKMRLFELPGVTRSCLQSLSGASTRIFSDLFQVDSVQF